MEGDQRGACDTSKRPVDDEHLGVRGVGRTHEMSVNSEPPNNSSRFGRTGHPDCPW